METPLFLSHDIQAQLFWFLFAGVWFAAVVYGFRRSVIAASIATVALVAIAHANTSIRSSVEELNATPAQLASASLCVKQALGKRYKQGDLVKFLALKEEEDSCKRRPGALQQAQWDALQTNIK